MCVCVSNQRHSATGKPTEARHEPVTSSTCAARRPTKVVKWHSIMTLAEAGLLACVVLEFLVGPNGPSRTSNQGFAGRSRGELNKP